MPIKDKSRYPVNWPEIREAVLLRSVHRCETCGVDNYTTHPVTGSKVVLTIHHKDHTPENCEYSNLIALCQRCHNTADAGYRTANRRKTIAEKQTKGCQVLGGLTLEATTNPQGLDDIERNY